MSMSKFCGYPRLNRQVEYKETLDSGEKRVDHLLVSVASNQTKQSRTHFGLIVSKKIGKAHVRNKIRRKLREIFRQLSIKGPITQPCSIVFITRKRAANASYKELESSVAKTLSRIKQKIT